MAAKRDLLEGSDEESEPITIKVNQEYARRYEHNKKREDLHRLQELQKQGLVSEDEPDSEEEDEDEDGRLPQRTEVQIFDTLAKIKKKDPEIYKEGVKFFEEEEDDDDDGESDEEPENAAGSSKKKPIYLKDVVGQGGMESDEDDEVSRSFKTYAEEQQELKDAVMKSIEDADISDEEEGFLKVKKKSKQELEIAAAEAEAKKKSSVVTRTLEEYFGKDDSLDENDRFLKNYLMNEGWVEKDKEQLPSYEDVVGEVSEDEDEIERQEQYEAAYNFRFEENAGSQVAGHSRIIENSVRKLPEKRKEQRKKKQERLLEAEAARREEVKRLKNLKKKEIMDKISKIKSVAGMADMEKIAEDDLEEDFDPDKYDKKMKEAFGDDYYEQEDADFHSDQEVDELVKPGGLWTEEIERNTKQELEQKMEEYYKLDYEDVVGDLPTRFKYTQVKPDMYGLTAAQILDSDDKELNQYISLKFLAPYRTDDPVPRHKHYRLTKKERKRKAMDQTPAITKKQDEDNQTGTEHSSGKDNQQAKKKQKAEKTNEQQQSTNSTAKQQKAEKANTEQQEKVDGQQENQKKRRRRKKGLGLSESRLISYGKIQPPKRQKH